MAGLPFTVQLRRAQQHDQAQQHLHLDFAHELQIRAQPEPLMTSSACLRTLPCLLGQYAAYAQIILNLRSLTLLPDLLMQGLVLVQLL